MKAPAELWTVAQSFGDLIDRVVFVGGMVRRLLVTDPGASGARPTKDVDCVVDLPSMGEFLQFSSSLRNRGFAECTDEGAPLCRWVVNSVRVDVMPIDPVVLGFSNVWYPSGVEHALRVTTPEGSIRIVNAVHFCATKVESFLSRGEGDFFHHDMEDLLEVVNSRHELVAELADAPADVREFLADTFEVWLADATFLSALPGHLPGDAANQARAYAGLIAAASHGRYFHQWIKGRYQHLPPTPLPGRVRTSTRRRPS